MILANRVDAFGVAAAAVITVAADGLLPFLF